MLSSQVSGYTQLTVSMLGHRGTATARKLTRTTHQKISIASIGTLALPAPRSTAERQCEAANRKKNTEQTFALPTPKAMASGSEVKAPSRYGAER